MDIALKIRGIYTTALTKFFLDHGVTIVSPAPPVAKRFNNHKNIDTRKPATIEITDLENRQGISVSGDNDHAKAVIKMMREAFPDTICRLISDGSINYTTLEFPSMTKSVLDELRQSVVPTVIDHHHLRLINSPYVDLMETMELAKHPAKRKAVSKNLSQRLIWDTFDRGKEIIIEHVKLNGMVLFLSEGEVIECHRKERRLLLKRSRFSGRSTYDGLDLPKKEGDYAVTEAGEGDFFYHHTYYRHDGQLIGHYFNVNTPVEFYPDKIRYVDLEIDVVKWPDGTVDIIDEELLERHAEAGYLSKALQEKAGETARELKRLLQG